MIGAARPSSASLERVVEVDGHLDVRRTVGHLVRGAGDPTMRLAERGYERASLTPDGPAAIRVRLEGGRLRAAAWGPGAVAALDGLPALLGLDDDATGFEPGRHALVSRLARGLPGVRIGRTGAVLEALLPAILEQRITGTEAARGYRRLVRAHGQPAPGPLDLWLPPSAEVLAALPSWTFPALGIEPRRGALVRRVARTAATLEAAAEPARRPGGGGTGASDLRERLMRFSGIGPWTAAEVTLRALGDPDAVSLGDAHLPNLVAWTLARERRGSDDRMLELLEPWRGHRARVIRLLETSGLRAPRFGPRVAPRDLARL